MEKMERDRQAAAAAAAQAIASGESRRLGRRTSSVASANSIPSQAPPVVASSPPVI